MKKNSFQKILFKKFKKNRITSTTQKTTRECTVVRGHLDRGAQNWRHPPRHNHFRVLHKDKKILIGEGLKLINVKKCLKFLQKTAKISQLFHQRRCIVYTYINNIISCFPVHTHTHTFADLFPA